MHVDTTAHTAIAATHMLCAREKVIARVLARTHPEVFARCYGRKQNASILLANTVHTNNKRRLPGGRNSFFAFIDHQDLRERAELALRAMELQEK
jgi:hypothetical protein